MSSSNHDRTRYLRRVQIIAIMMTAFGLPFLLFGIVLGAQVSAWHVLVVGLFSERAILAICKSKYRPLLSSPEFVQKLIERVTKPK